MAKFVKVILCLLFVIAVCDLTDSFFAQEKADQTEYALFNASTTLCNETQESVTSAQTPYFPDAELTGTGVLLHQLMVSRILRINNTEYFLSLKQWVQKQTESKDILAMQLDKLYDTTVLPSSRTVSEYYVFALRRILI